MRLLVDENISRGIVDFFRTAGHDVVYIADEERGREDSELLAIAFSENRVVVTDDKDFGELVFHQREKSAGVVLLRLHKLTPQDRLKRIAVVWPTIERQPRGAFVVLNAKSVRVRLPR